MQNKFSICIPRVEYNITKNKIYSVLNRYKFGKIKNVILIPNHKKKCKVVYIYYNYMNDNDFVNSVKTKMLNGENIKIIYNKNEPWFWKLVMNKNS